jgi:EAL domain-containing protein (putative c-di-GMP-specific phosphodiesterase class I)
MSRPPSRTSEDYFRLRAEWLRFKNHVHDSNTGLPTLAAVLDDVRRLLEERDSVLLLYLDLADEEGFEATHGWHAYDETLRAFARALLGLRTEGLLRERDVTAVAGVRSDKFLVFMAGAAGGGTEGARAAAERVTRRLAASFPAALRPTLPAPPAVHYGHALVHRDPMLRAENAIHRALDEAMLASLRRRSHEQDRRERELDELIAGGRVRTLYQPIVQLHDRRVLGHEVFSHAPAGGALGDAESLFALAERSGRILEFERLCRGHALASARRHLPAGGKLFLNTSASALHDPELLDGGLVRSAGQAGLLPAQLVLEITERVALGERQAYREALRELKAAGFGLAIDDMGAGYSSLQGVVEVEPDYMKFDVSLVRDIDRNLIKRSLLETLVDLARRIGARVVAEGIEFEREIDTLRACGVELGQGRLLAPPRLVPDEEGTRG